MSIKALSNQDCPICKIETLHKACVCQTCGNIKATPAEQRKQATNRIHAKYHKRYGPQAMGVLVAKTRKGKPMDIDPRVDSLPKVSTATFGRGREKKKI